MLTVAEIRRHCYFQNSYSRGQDLYFSKKYRNLRIMLNAENGASEVTAEVKGSGSVWYNTRVAVCAAGDEIEDYSCECASYQQTASMCKHCVAAALVYQADQKSNRPYRRSAPTAEHTASSASKTTQKPSDYALLSLLHRFIPAAEEDLSDISGSIVL